MLSGTGSNRGTKCIPRLARFNPRLALIGFLGTRGPVEQQPLVENTMLAILPIYSVNLVFRGPAANSHLHKLFDVLQKRALPLHVIKRARRSSVHLL